MSEEHSMDCVDEHRCDLGMAKAYRDAVIPTLMGEPNSVMYQTVVTAMGDLIREVECLRRQPNVTHIHVSSPSNPGEVAQKVREELIRIGRNNGGRTL